jgi:hypothetical protein
MSGTFDTIKVGNVGDKFFYCDNDISGTFKNIKAEDVVGNVFSSTNLISGIYKNISVNSVSGFFSGVNINGTFDDISVFSNDSTSFYANSILFGTFSNIKIDSTDGNSFNSDDTLGGYYDGITIGTSIGTVLNSGASPVQGTFKNIKVTSCSGFFESGSTITPTLVENIEVGEVTTTNFISAAVSIGGIYKNVKVGSVNQRAFIGVAGITGTYSNIEVISSGDDIFGSESTINVNVDGAKLTSSADIFTINGGGTILGKINKLTAYGNDVFPGGLADGNGRAGETFFGGKLINSTIIKNGSVYAVNLNSGSIERCKVITNTAIGKGIYGSGQVIYNLTNQTIDATGVVSQNVTDSDITS